MSEDVTVTGLDEWYRLSKALKAAGQTGMRKALHQGLQRAAKPLIRIDREAARRLLPKQGGLNVRMAKAPQRVRVRTGDNPRITIELPGKQRGYNDGVIRHPVHERDKANRRGGNGVRWVEQSGIDSTWFDDTLAASAPTVRDALEGAVQEVFEQIIREAS